MSSVECSKWKSSTLTRSCIAPKVSDQGPIWSRSNTLKLSSPMLPSNKTKATLENNIRWESPTWEKSGNTTSVFWTTTEDWPRMKERNKKKSKSVLREEEATVEVVVIKATLAMVVAVAIRPEEVVVGSDPVEEVTTIVPITTTIVVDN